MVGDYRDGSSDGGSISWDRGRQERQGMGKGARLFARHQRLYPEIPKASFNVASCVCSSRLVAVHLVSCSSQRKASMKRTRGPLSVSWCRALLSPPRLPVLLYSTPCTYRTLASYQYRGQHLWEGFNQPVLGEAASQSMSASKFGEQHRKVCRLAQSARLSRTVSSSGCCELVRLGCSKFACPCLSPTEPLAAQSQPAGNSEDGHCHPTGCKLESLVVSEVRMHGAEW
jgi:hypothetical protein